MTVSTQTISKSLGINCRFLQARVTGVERYALNVVNSLIPEAKGRGYKIKAFVPRNSAIPSFLNSADVELVETELWPSAVGRHLWEQLVLPMLAGKHKVGVLLNLTNTAPIGFRSNVLTLHDVSWIEQPASFSPLFRICYQLLVPLVARRAKQLVTVSQCSAEHIHKYLQVPMSRILVIKEGVGVEVSSQPARDDQSVLNRYDLSGQYLLHVGTLQPRKNIDRLIAAHDLLCEQLGDNAPYLILVGGNSGHFASISAANSELRSRRKRLLGYVPDCDLPVLYSNALAYVTASLCEGFNLPILEAMACDTPVLASDIAIHHEVAGDAAVFFDPLKESAICSAMRTVVEDEKLRSDLVARGVQRAAQYSWSAHAASLMDAIDAIVPDS
jgi:glycosyltransferase involved in cell wall biosynthesis